MIYGLLILILKEVFLYNKNNKNKVNYVQFVKKTFKMLKIE